MTPREVPLDLDALRAAVDAELDPDWAARYGDESWRAAMAVLGELEIDDALQT